MALSPAERARLDALRQVRDGGEGFAAFVRRTCPELGTVVPRHLVRLYDLIEQTRRRAVWATISMPPRLGKSTSMRAGIVFRQVRDPSCQHFYITFGDSLATEFSDLTRKLARRAGVPLGRENVHDWKIDLGASPAGGLKATSVGGDITGRGSRGGIIVGDDLIKGREAAESKLVRDKTWTYLLDDVLSRRDDDRVSVLIPGTRWHLDDPIGRILRDDLGETWDHVKLPAVIDATTGAPVDGGPRGEDFDPAYHVPIWPEGGKGIAWARKERAKGAHRWWSLYQQEPRTRDSKVFEHEPARFNLDTFNLDGWRLNFTIDPAGTAKTSSDYWAGVVTAVRGFGDACEGRVLAKLHMQARLPAVLRAAKVIRERYPLPLKIECIGGFALLPDSIAMIDPLMPVEPIPSHILRGDKMARAAAYAEAWNSGRFAVPLGADWDEYIDEHLEFTGINDAHDDQVDASAHGWNLGWRGAPEMLVGGIMTAADFPGYRDD